MEEMFQPMPHGGMDIDIPTGRPMAEVVALQKERAEEKREKEVELEGMRLAELDGQAGILVHNHIKSALSMIEQLMPLQPTEVHDAYLVMRFRVTFAALDSVIGRENFQTEFARHAVLQLVARQLGIQLPAQFASMNFIPEHRPSFENEGIHHARP